MPVRKLARSLVGLACLAGVPVLAELGARWAIRRFGGYYPRIPFWREEHQFDPATVPQFPSAARVDINALGERGDPPPRPDEPALRVLVVGGSAAECCFLDQSATWSGVAQRALSAPESLARLGVPRVHVGNVSRAILPVRDLVVLLERILPRYPRVDLVVVMMGGADAVTWVERGMPSTYAPAPTDMDKLFEQHPERRWGWRPSQTALWSLASGLRRRAVRPVVFSPDAAGWMRDLRRMRADAPHRVDAIPDPAPMLDRFEEGLRSLIAVAKRRTPRIVVVRQPWFGPTPTPEEEAMFWNFGLGRPYREAVDTYLTPGAVDALMRAMDSRCARVTEQEGVRQVDTMATLERSSRTFYDELHLTPAGAEVLGHLTAEAVLASVADHPLGSSAPASVNRRRRPARPEDAATSRSPR